MKLPQTTAKKASAAKRLKNRQLHKPSGGLKRQQQEQRLQRLLCILWELNNKKTWYISGFAKEHHVTRRTVQKDILFLSRQYPISRVKDAFHKDTYKFEHSFRFFPSENQVDNALLKLTRDLTANFDKDFILTNHDAKFSSKDNYFYIKFPRTNPKTLSFKGVKMGVLKTALESKRYLDIKYISVQNKVLTLFFAPLKICFYNGLWYLLGFQENDQTHLYRLRLDLIQSLNFPADYLTFNYKGTPIEKLLDEAGDMFFPSDGSQDKTITLAVDKKVSSYFEKKFYFRNQHVTPTNAGLKVTCSATDFMEVFPVVRQWIPYVKIISPKEWADQFLFILQTYVSAISATTPPSGRQTE